MRYGYPVAESYYPPYRASTPHVQYPVTRSGVRLNYNSGNAHLLLAIIQITTGQTAQAFAEEHLFGPLGIPPDDMR